MLGDLQNIFARFAGKKFGLAMFGVAGIVILLQSWIEWVGPVATPDQVTTMYVVAAAAVALLVGLVALGQGIADHGAAQGRATETAAQLAARDPAEKPPGT